MKGIVRLINISIIDVSTLMHIEHHKNKYKYNMSNSHGFGDTHTDKSDDTLYTYRCTSL